MDPDIQPNDISQDMSMDNFLDDTFNIFSVDGYIQKTKDNRKG